MEITPETSIQPISSSQIMPNGPDESTLWQRDLQNAFRNVGHLLGYLEIGPDLETEFDPKFPIRVPLSFAQKMGKGNIHDPLLKQVLPIKKESLNLPGFVPDAVGDSAAHKAPGLLHKYGNRALMLPTSQCAVHCRYCFRKEFEYSELPRQESDWNEAFQYLAAHSEINEVILSGGDPLSLSDAKLNRLCGRLMQNKSIQTLRWHTRYPIVLPSRINSELLDLVASITKRISLVIVVHANHPNEIGDDVREGLASLRKTGATLLNQSVLLKGVNDSSETLAELSRRLFQAGVLPYYLSQLDRVSGSAHFEVPIQEGLQIVEALRKQVQGYLVPRYVQEIAGGLFKEPL